MRRIATRVAVIGVGVLVLRALAPKLHERCLGGCKRMFEQMPEDFPPKRMMLGIDEIRADTARTLELLEERKEASESEPRGEVPSTKAVGHAA